MIMAKVVEELTNAFFEDAKSRFLHAYANVPLGLRNQEIILLIEDKPMTWDVAYIEVEKETKKSKEILRKLVELELI